MLQDYTKHQKQVSKQATEHTSNVVVALQSKLADTSMSFKDVLEIRTEVKKTIYYTTALGSCFFNSRYLCRI